MECQGGREVALLEKMVMQRLLMRRHLSRRSEAESKAQAMAVSGAGSTPGRRT